MAKQHGVNDDKQFIYFGMTNKKCCDIEITKENNDLCTPDQWYECNKKKMCQKVKTHKKKNFKNCDRINIPITRQKIGDDYEHRWWN